MDVEQFTTFGNKGFIEIHEEIPFLFEERTEIILEILEEGRVEVGGFQCIPMLMLPIGMRADTNVLHQTFSPSSKVALVNRYGQMKRTIRRINGASIADGLLLKVLVLFNENWFARQEMSEP